MPFVYANDFAHSLLPHAIASVEQSEIPIPSCASIAGLPDSPCLQVRASAAKRGPSMSTVFVLILLIWTGMHVYVFWRASSLPVVASHVPRKVLYSAGCILAVSYIAAHFLHHFGVTGVSRFLEAVGANWIGVLFLLFVAMLAVDVVTAFGFWLPELARRLRGWALIAGSALSIIALVQGSRPPVVQRYDVQLRGLPASFDGTLIVFASDFHLGTMLGEHWLTARIDQIQAQRPDIIVLGGDIVEGDDASEAELLPLFRRLSAPAGVWAVTGNHESHRGGINQGSTLREQSGLHVLHDRSYEVKPGLVLAGVDDLTSRRHNGDTRDYVAQSLAGRRDGIATVLVSHTPWDVDVAAQSGVGLMLASHTHDGQIWPFRYIVGLNHPFLAGRYAVGSMTLLVCRGTGGWGPRMRLWKRAELIKVALHSPAVETMVAHPAQN